MAVEDGEGGECDGVHYDHLTQSETNVQKPVTVVECGDAHISCSEGNQRGGGGDKEGGISEGEGGGGGGVEGDIGGVGGGSENEQTQLVRTSTT